MNYIENEIVVCGECGYILFKQYGKTTSCSEWFCIKCNKIARNIFYITQNKI